MRLFIEEGLTFDERVLAMIATSEDSRSSSAVGIRESLQYGVALSLEDDAYTELLELARRVIDQTKRLLV